ncbi:hypothetical protein LCGC14_0305660 [marine sediment metagenome]|uniref:Uncharacterized protein n=1 Tax=marine sediment metagenome TaxID=412755 RepID=A0A0F9U616_9ZZZZ
MKINPEDEFRVSCTFVCKCKKAKGWIAAGRITTPCPNCGRKYSGFYSPKKMQILAKEIE